MEVKVPLTHVWTKKDMKDFLNEKFIYLRETDRETLRGSLHLSYDPRNPDSLAVLSQKVLYCEFEDLPLFINTINEPGYSRRLLASAAFKWRMEKGK